MHEKKLHRSENNKIVAGVCGGLAEYFETDPVIVRVIFVFLSFIGAGGIILYLVLWLLLPVTPSHTAEHSETHRNTDKDFVHDIDERLRKNHGQARGIAGLLIILLGIVFLIDNFFPGFGFNRFWPLFLIILGIMIIFRNN